MSIAPWRRVSRPAWSPMRRPTWWPTTTIDVIVELMGGDEPAHTLIARRAVDGQGASSPRTSTSSPTTGRSSRRSPGGPGRRCASRRRSAAGSRSSGRWPATSPPNRDRARPRDRQRHDELHPERHDRRGRTARLRGGTGRGTAARLRGGRPVGRHRGARRGQQAGDPRPPGVRSAGSIRRRSPTRPDGARRPGRPGHHRRSASPTRTRPARPGGSSGSSRPRRAARGDRIAAAVLPTALPLDSALGRTAGVRNRIEVDAVPVGRSGSTVPGAGGAATVLGRPRRPHRDRARGRIDLGPAARRDRPVRRPGPAPRRRGPRERRAASGTRSMTDRAGAPVAGPAAARRSAIARFLPVTDATPPLTLGEGVHAARPRRAPRGRARAREPLPQGRGPEPDRLVQGPRHGRWPSPRRPRRARRAIVCASTGNTSASAAAYGAAAGMEVIVVLPKGQIAIGKLLQALIAGARVVAIDGNFDQALGIVRALAEQDDHPVTLVNSVNPFRLEGQKTAAFEICDDLGRAPDVLAIPVGNAGNISAYWAGLPRLRGGRDRRRRRRGCGASRRPAPRRSWSATGSSTRRRSRPRSGSATRRRGRRRSTRATRRGGRIEAVTDDEILAAYRALARLEGIFCEPASAAGVAGVTQGRRRRRAGPRRARRVRADRPRPQGPDDRRAPGRRRSSRPSRPSARSPSRWAGRASDGRPLARGARWQHGSPSRCPPRRPTSAPATTASASPSR